MLGGRGGGVLPGTLAGCVGSSIETSIFDHPSTLSSLTPLIDPRVFLYQAG